MILTATYSFKVTRDTLFAALIDPTVVQRCIDVCETIMKTSDDNYDLHLKIGGARLGGSYIAMAQLKDKKPPESFTLVMENKSSPGFVKGTAKIKLTNSNNETELKCNADVQVGGLIAVVGSRRIEAAAKKMLDEFFRKFGELL
jgi:carbon monoxide dehydrogenase subunit G